MLVGLCICEAGRYAEKTLSYVCTVTESGQRGAPEKKIVIWQYRVRRCRLDVEVSTAPACIRRASTGWPEASCAVRGDPG